jgi:hypothetical protein
VRPVAWSIGRKTESCFNAAAKLAECDMAGSVGLPTLDDLHRAMGEFLTEAHT